MDPVNKKQFQWPDYAVFFLVLSISASIGLYHGVCGKSHNSITQYLLANRKMNWIPVGLSILVTFLSGILFIGVPSEIYVYGISFILFNFSQGISVIITAYLIVPLLFPLKLTSAYEYLERRFKSKVPRYIGSLLGILNMVLYMGVVIYVPAICMGAVSGFPIWASIILTAGVATFYTTLGGMKAVIWSDVFQFCIMSAGLLAILIKGTIQLGGFEKVWNLSKEGGRTEFKKPFDMDPRTRHTVWSVLIGGTFVWLANIGVNQNNVQRFSSVSTLREAKRSLLTAMPGFVIMGLIATFMGLIIFAFYANIKCDPLQNGDIDNLNQLVPYFVIEVFHFLPGFSGLFVSALFCASLSTVSSSINGLAAMTWEDLLKPNFTKFSERKETLFVKGLVFVYGAIGMIVSLIVMTFGGSVINIALSFFGASGGPLLGMFLLGALFPWANWKGVSVGAISAFSLTMWIAVGGNIIKPIDKLHHAGISGCPSVNHSSVANGDHLHGNGFTQVTNIPTVAYGVHSNDTIDEYESGVLSYLVPLYRISYMWYSLIGLTMVIVIGLTVSFLTGPTKPMDLEPELIFPIVDRWCCCLPANVRKKMSCNTGISDESQDPKQAESETCLQNDTPLERKTGEENNCYETNV